MSSGETLAFLHIASDMLISDTPTRAHVASPTPEPAPIPVVSGAEKTAPPTPPPSSGGDDDEDDDDTTEPPARLNRKQRRALKHKANTSTLPTPSNTDNEADSPRRKPPNNPPKKRALNNPTSASVPASLTPPDMGPGNPFPLLICSIGNPGATYANTLHSAGHIVTSYIAQRKSHKPFTKGLSGLVARPDNTSYSFSLLGGFSKTETGGTPEDDWTFWQSTSLMNVSGAGVKRAYNEWLRDVRRAAGNPAAEGRLVVVHDELEASLGKVAIRDGGASPKGHNGLKSCQAHLGGIKWWRVAVGIGRPESRDPNVVSRYVLGKMAPAQRIGLEKSSVGVVGALRLIAEGKR
jgi:PTH1 family peptidyl-tRNA hydrolase